MQKQIVIILIKYLVCLQIVKEQVSLCSDFII